MATLHDSSWPRARRTSVAFTLLELLVVVFIISLLLLLISPTIQLVLEHRAKVTCLRNLKSQHVAGMQYADDWERKLVPIKPRTTAPATAYSDELQKYLEYNDMVFRCPSVTDLSNDLDSANQKILCYGINHYGRADNDKVSADYWDTFDSRQPGSPPTVDAVGDTDVIWFADADYDDSPHDIGGASRKKYAWPIYYSFHRDAWNRHMGGRDPDIVYGKKQADPGYYAAVELFDNGDPSLKKFLGGYNAVSLDGAAKWRPGNVPANEAWWIKKHKASN